MIPITDDRLFTKPADTNVFTNTPFYTAEEYEYEYPVMLLGMPNIFSINLQDDIIEFMTSTPPAFTVNMHEVIDFACFYYSDWDTAHMAVMDEFIEVNALDEIRQHLVRACYDYATAEKELQRQIDMLSEALRKFITTVLSVLARANVPAIMDFGSCYRLENIDDWGNVFFKIQPPDRIFDEIENSCLLARKAVEPTITKITNTIILTGDAWSPGNY